MRESPDLAALLADVARVAGVPPEAVPDLLAELERVRAALWQRLTAPALPPTPAGERLLTVDEAAARCGMSRDWLYRHARTLPFARRVGRSLRFSETALERWLSTRQR